MTPEALELKRLSDGEKTFIRETKAKIRHLIEVTQPSPDTTAWNLTVRILRMELPNYDELYAPHEPVLHEFFDIRRMIWIGDLSKVIDGNKGFREKYDPNLLSKLQPPISKIIDIIGKPR
jgi:hypothetical protein